MRADSLSSRLRALVVPLGSALVIGYFAWHAVASDTGLIVWGGYQAEKRALEAEAARVAAAKAALEHRVALLNPQRVDPDLADELVRDQLGVVRPDEVVVPLPQGD